MTSSTVPAMILTALLSTGSGLALADQLPMPPTFARQADAEQTLRAYPLGVITRQVAFSHHGEAHREVNLPNGLTGWVYDVGGLPESVTYLNPSGERRTIRETELRHRTLGYTLVFDHRGMVIDVLYNEDGRHDGLTALSLQYRKDMLRTEEHTHPAGR